MRNEEQFEIMTKSLEIALKAIDYAEDGSVDHLVDTIGEIESLQWRRRDEIESSLKVFLETLTETLHDLRTENYDLLTDEEKIDDEADKKMQAEKEDF